MSLNFVPHRLTVSAVFVSVFRVAFHRHSLLIVRYCRLTHFMATTFSNRKARFSSTKFRLWFSSRCFLGDGVKPLCTNPRVHEPGYPAREGATPTAIHARQDQRFWIALTRRLKECRYVFLILMDNDVRYGGSVNLHRAVELPIQKMSKRKPAMHRTLGPSGIIGAVLPTFLLGVF